MSRPWMNDQNFPLRPADAGAFGYRTWGTDRALSSEEQLKQTIPAKLFSPGLLVWTPANPHLLPPFEFDSLRGVTKSAWQRNAATVGRWMPWCFLFVLVSELASLADPTTPPAMYVQSALLVASLAATSAYIGWDAMRSKRWAEHDEADIREGIRFFAWLLARPNFWRNALAGTVVLTFLAQLVVDNVLPWPEDWLNASVAAAGFSKIYFGQGEWWRLVTGSLLHHNASHLLGNLLALTFNATAVAALACDALVPLVVLLGVVVGGLLSLVIYPTAISVGISAGLSALSGFLLLMLVRRRALLPARLLAWMLFSAWLGFAQDFTAWGRIDIAAHIGGFSAGFALAALMIRRDEMSLPIPVSTRVERLGIASGIVFGVTAMAVLGLFASALMKHAGIT